MNGSDFYSAKMGPSYWYLQRQRLSSSLRHFKNLTLRDLLFYPRNSHISGYIDLRTSNIVSCSLKTGLENLMK
jgi:hypothetical protein